MTASNFKAFWDFCQLPNHDGEAGDGPDTRWGFTFETWVSARRYEGYRDISRATFGEQTQMELEPLAQSFFWERQGGVLLPAGLDVSVIDWVWTSGGAVFDIQQRLGNVAVDGWIGPETVKALTALSDPLQAIHDWRIAYYVAIGLLVVLPEGYHGEDPGLGYRTDDCLHLAESLVVVNPIG
jgi:lysozyme family protein